MGAIMGGVDGENAVYIGIKQKHCTEVAVPYLLCLVGLLVGDSDG